MKEKIMKSRAEFLLYTVLSIGLAGCIQTQGHEEESTTADSSGQSSLNIVTNVKTMVCAKKPFIYELKCNGKLKASREQVWIAENAGLVKEFSGDNGKRYQLGEIIASFDPSQINLKLERAALEKFNKQREYESQLLGYATLLSGKQPAEVDSIKKKLRIASGLALVEQDIREAHLQLERLKIKAPFTGVLAQVHLQKGNQFNAGDILFTLYDDRTLFMETEVLETDLGKIKLHDPAEVTPIGDLNIIVKAIVDNINPYVNDKGMVTIRLKIDHTNGSRLFPGMHCNAVIKLKAAEGIIIPKTALIKRNGKAVVFTMIKGEANWNDVLIGQDNGTDIEILSGLRIGDKVIITNNTQLAHQSPVNED